MKLGKNKYTKEVEDTLTRLSLNSDKQKADKLKKYIGTQHHVHGLTSAMQVGVYKSGFSFTKNSIEEDFELFNMIYHESPSFEGKNLAFIFLDKNHKHIPIASQLQIWTDKKELRSSRKRATIDDKKNHAEVNLDDSLFHDEAKPKGSLDSKAIKETIDSNEPTSIDALITNAGRLGVPVEDSRKNGFGSILFKLTDTPETKDIPLVQALIASGFQYLPGKGYWR